MSIYDARLASVFAYQDDLEDAPVIGFKIKWEGSRGFGEIRFELNCVDNTLTIDSESMDEKFVKEVMCKFIELTYSMR